MCWWFPMIELCLRSASQVWTTCSTSQLSACNFGTQLETGGPGRCFNSKCPLILRNLRTDVKLLIGNKQGEAEE